jgi:hypothetical protein
MSKFIVNIPLVSYYEVEIDAETEIDAHNKAVQLMPSEINIGEYQGWDIDSRNIVVNKIEVPDFIAEHFKIINIA